MTKNQKIRLGASVTLTVLALLCAVAFFIVNGMYAELEPGDITVEGTLGEMKDALYVYVQMAGYLLALLLLAVAGLILAAGAAVLGINWYWRIPGFVFLALHLGLVIYFLAVHGGMLFALFAMPI